MFYIKKILIYTDGGEVSSVDLSPKLNIIYGESNTGKSLVLDCIDYMTGAKEHRFDAKLKVNQIALVLDVEGQSITMRREIDSNDIEVSSLVSSIESGVYKLGNAKKNINSVWLNLLGIDDNVKIINTLAGKPQRFTLRTFIHTILLDETRIQGPSSILAQGTGKSKNVATSVLTAYLYLATGNNYMPDEAAQDPKIKKAKKDAVMRFVDRSMAALESKKASELKNFSEESPAELQKKVNSTIDEISAAEGALEEASSKARQLAESIFELDNQIAECKMLLNRNESLMSQYESDIRRLTFIVEGDIQHDSLPTLDVCPFCNGKLTKRQGESCINAAIAEVEKIETQVRDLKSVQSSLAQEVKKLETARVAVVAERKKVNLLISGELQPQIVRLRTQLSEYTISLNQYKAKEMIDAFSDVLISELTVSENEDSSDFKFNAREKFKEIFENLLQAELKELLETCNYQHFTGVRFDTDIYDVVVNGHLKKSQGQGYRAFLNTILAVALQNCLDRLGHFVLPFMVIDSPILSLKEKGDQNGTEVVSDTMKAGLFRYFVQHHDTRQILIIENIIPNIDYGQTKLIHFTKDENNGRYGLIQGYRE